MSRSWLGPVEKYSQLQSLRSKTAHKCGHVLTTKVRLAAASFSLLMTSALFTASAHAAVIDVNNKILFNSGGVLNGQAVDSAGTTITVKAGELISGTLNISVFNGHSTNGTFPVGATVTWGDRATQARELIPHVDNGVLTNFPAISFSEFAPTTNGLYYIILGGRGECGFEHVMSATNWRLPASNWCGDSVASGPEATPVWNDGNDLGWDWTPDQFLQAQNDGQVTQQLLVQNTGTPVYQDNITYGANWIAVKVVPVPAAAWLFASGLLGVIGIARCKCQNNSNKIARRDV